MRNFLPFWANTTNRIQTPDGKPGMSDKRLKEPELDYNGIYGRGIGRCRLTWYSSNAVWDDSNDLRHTPGNWMKMTDLVYNNPDLKGTPYYHQPIRLWSDDGQLLCIDTLRNWGRMGTLQTLHRGSRCRHSSPVQRWLFGHVYHAPGRDLSITCRSLPLERRSGFSSA